MSAPYEGGAAVAVGGVRGYPDQYDMRAGLVGAQANALTKQPRLEAAAARLEYLIDNLEKTLAGAHVQLDRSIGSLPPRGLNSGNGVGRAEEATAPSQLHRLDRALERLETQTTQLAGALLERLAGL